MSRIKRLLILKLNVIINHSLILFSYVNSLIASWIIKLSDYLHDRVVGLNLRLLILRRGSWRPIGHMRPSSPLLDSVRDQFEDYDQLAKDFTRVFLNSSANVTLNASLFDVSFLVPGQQKQKVRFIGVRAILAVRSR